MSEFPSIRNPRQNLLLAALSPAEFERLQPDLEWVELALGHDRSRRQAAKAGRHSQQPGPDHCAGSVPARGALLRVLCGSQEGDRSLIAHPPAVTSPDQSTPPGASISPVAFLEQKAAPLEGSRGAVEALYT